MKKLILISALILGGLILYGIEKPKPEFRMDTYSEFTTINAAISKIIQPGMTYVPKDKIKELIALTAYRDQLVVSLEATNPEMITTLRKWYYWMCNQCSALVWCGFCGSGSCCGWSSSNTCINCGNDKGSCRNIFCN